MKKGFLLNFAYEGSYIIYKLLIFCFVFYCTQVWVAYSACKNQADIIRYTSNYNSTGYLWFSEIFNKSVMPYILTAFIIASFFGVYYIFKKDKIGSNKTNAIYTLPCQRYCNFIAKLFYCILCPLSVYVVQILANMTIIQLKIGNIGFRDNELYLSSQFDGIYQTLFTPSPIMAFIILTIITVVVQFFRDYTLKSIAISNDNLGFKSKIQSAVITIWLVTAINLMFNSKYIPGFWVYFYAIGICVVSIIIDIVVTYRKVRV